MNRELNNTVSGASNFKYKELIYSEYAIRNGISNIPNEEQWQNLEKLAVNILQPIRETFGPIRITSAFRNSKLNNEIGGARNSYHLYGMAADIEPVYPEVRFIDIVKFVYKNLNYSELITEHFPLGWLHIAYNDKNFTKDIKIKDNKHNYTTVTIEELKDYYDNL